MRGSYDPRGASYGLRLAIYQTHSGECPSLSYLIVLCACVYAPYTRLIYALPVRLCLLPIIFGTYWLLFLFPLFLLFLFCVCFLLSLELYFVDVSLIFSCQADHVPDRQPRILLGTVEAQSVNNVKSTQTHTDNLYRRHKVNNEKY